MARARLDENESPERHDPGGRRAERRKAARVALHTDQSVDQRSEPGRCEHRPEYIDVARRAFIAALVDPKNEHRDHDERDWHVDEENGAPRTVLHEHAAEHGSERRRHRGETRPRSDRFPARFATEVRADQREAPRRRERRTDALQAAPGEQHRNVRSERARERGRGEEGDPRSEDAFAPEDVAERSADEHQRRKKKGVRLHNPLAVLRGRVQIALNHRQRDVDRRAVDEAHARPENRGDECPIRGG